MLFSNRYGFKKVSDTIQLKSMNEDLKISIWNIFEDNFSSNFSWLHGQGNIYTAGSYLFCKSMCRDLLKISYDRIPLNGYLLRDWLKNIYDQFQWSDVYDFIEFIGSKYPYNEKFHQELNKIMERENAAYRIIDGIVSPVSESREIHEIEEAVGSVSAPWEQHFHQALFLLSDRKTADYRNSVKESVLALEAYARHVSGAEKATLADALKILEKVNKLHPALKEAFNKLYGYSSDEGGIRHALMTENNIDYADAKYFLVTFSSFVNYLKMKLI